MVRRGTKQLVELSEDDSDAVNDAIYSHSVSSSSSCNKDLKKVLIDSAEKDYNASTAQNQRKLQRKKTVLLDVMLKEQSGGIKRLSLEDTRDHWKR